MKCAGKYINLKNAKASVFGKTTDLVVTKSGHHAVPLTVLYQIIHIQNSSKVNETSLHSNDKKNRWPGSFGIDLIMLQVTNC